VARRSDSHPAPQRRRYQRHPWALALTVCLSRMWVGAHLPLDVLGGAALGWVAGVVVHLLLGAPGGQPSGRSLRRTLVRAGLDPIQIDPLPGWPAAGRRPSTSPAGPRASCSSR